MRVVVVVFHVHTGITYTYNFINMYSIEYIYICMRVRLYGCMLVLRLNNVFGFVRTLVSF